MTEQQVLDQWVAIRSNSAEASYLVNCSWYLVAGVFWGGARLFSKCFDVAVTSTEVAYYWSLLS